MDKRFFNMFGLSEEQAIALLQTPIDQLAAPTEHYVAVSHLINFPTERSINALIEVINNPSAGLYDRITRRKAVESLGRLQARVALPTIRACLDDEDGYTVENAVWAIGEIGSEDRELLAEIADLLDQPDRAYRTIIQTLAKLNYQSAAERIAKFTDAEDRAIASAAISALSRLTGDNNQMPSVVEFLQHESVNVRRASIQDLIDARYYEAIPAIARCPVSIAFRLRALRLLAESGFATESIDFTAIEPHLDRVIFDRPKDLELVHEYDQKPSLEFAIGELYHTDFGRCYLAAKTLLESYATEAPAALFQTWEKEAHNDYGAHYHVIKLFGWLQHAPAWDLFVAALDNTSPQFQKSRAAAAIALGNLGDEHAISRLQAAANTKIFDLKYACLLALNQLGDTTVAASLQEDDNRLIRAKAQSLLERAS